MKDESNVMNYIFEYSNIHFNHRFKYIQRNQSITERVHGFLSFEYYGMGCKSLGITIHNSRGHVAVLRLLILCFGRQEEIRCIQFLSFLASSVESTRLFVVVLVQSLD